MQEDKVPYEKQIFVCTNDRKGESPSCGDNHGEEIFKQLRQIAKDRGLHPMMRVAQAKCLGKCGLGGNIMVYPDGVWHQGVRVEDVPALANKYLKDQCSTS